MKTFGILCVVLALWEIVNIMVMKTYIYNTYGASVLDFFDNYSKSINVKVFFFLTLLCRNSKVG